MAVVGVIGTATAGIAGVLITQRRSDVRETNAAERERQRAQEQWQRERDRERERWAREDKSRTFEQRREAYVDFYQSLRRLSQRINEHGQGLIRDNPDPPSDLPFGFQEEAEAKLQRLQLYASKQVATAASAAYHSTWNWGLTTTFGNDDQQFSQLEEESDTDIEELLEAIRSDLAVPEDSPPASKE